MKYFTLTEQRNRRLRHEIQKERSARPRANADEIIDSVLNRPLARGFYIGVDSAIVTERGYRSGKIPLPPGKRGRIWADFITQVNENRARQPGLTLVEAICRTIACGTSHEGFALSRESARRIIKNCQIANRRNKTSL